jgi:hypothetical protein
VGVRRQEHEADNSIWYLGQEGVELPLHSHLNVYGMVEDRFTFTFTFTNLFVMQSLVLKRYLRFGHFDP